MEKGNLYHSQAADLGFPPELAGKLNVGSTVENSFSVFGLTQEDMNAVNGKYLEEFEEWKTLSIDAVGQSSDYYDLWAVSKEIYTVGQTQYLGITEPPQILATVETPKVTVSAVDSVANETSGDTGQFMVLLNAPTTKDIRVKFTIDGKATRGKDYQRFPNSLIIPAGNVSGIIEVFPVDDVKHEGTETIKLKLVSAPKNSKAYAIGNRKNSFATVKIIDND